MIDRLGGFWGSRDADEDFDDDVEDFDDTAELPPTPVGQDERRMQVRAYNHWASLLGDRDFPDIDHLEPDMLADFGPYSVLLDLSGDVANPRLRYVGSELVSECDLDGMVPPLLADVPGRSVLSRITDHYMQILANQAPIGFEAEFVGASGATLLYRGILLPYSSDDRTIDYIYGVINWKEIADQQTADELLLEIDQALAATEADPAREPVMGPEALTGTAFSETGHDDESVLELASADAIVAEASGQLPRPTFGSMADVADDDAVDLPAATGGSGRLDALGNPVGAHAASEADWDEPDDYDNTIKTAADYGLPEWDEDEEEDDDVEAVVDPLGDEDATSSLVALVNRGDRTKKSVDLTLGESEGAQPAAFAAGDGSAPPMPQAYEPPVEPESLQQEEPGPTEFAVFTDRELPHDNHVASIETAATEPAGTAEPSEEGLYDHLAAAREMAQAAQNTEDRSRKTLYEAVGRAYDFSLAAQHSRAEFDALLADNGLTQQDRAPMTPVVKLVFGADYDKTRLTEYAAVLMHAHRRSVAPGTLATFLREADGGLKGVVAEERRLRKQEQGKPSDGRKAVRPALADKLRAIEPLELADLEEADGAEFALVMVRRTPTGAIEIIGEVPDDVPLVERAARKLLD